MNWLAGKTLKLFAEVRPVCELRVFSTEDGVEHFLYLYLYQGIVGIDEDLCEEDLCGGLTDELA